jgi:hypothetical protein
VTPAQLDQARAALEELQLLYQARLDHVAACVVLLDHLDCHGLPTPPTIGVPGWVDSLVAIGEGMDWMAEFIATGAGEGRRQLSVRPPTVAPVAGLHPEVA